MALNPGSMVQGFTQLFNSDPSSPQIAAEKMATIYDSYAQTAMAGATLPVFTGSQKSTLQSLLLAAISVPLIGAPPLIAAAWGSGLVAYWMAPPIIFLGPGMTGLVSVAAGCLSAIPALTTVYANPMNTPDSAAAQIATALDTATRTVLVQVIVIAPPATLVVPLV
jgi:hypothetical protein